MPGLAVSEVRAMTRLSLGDLPEFPTNSAIHVEETSDGLELRWLNPRWRILAGRRASLIALFVLGGWVVAGALLGWQLGRSLGQGVPPAEAFDWFRIAVLGTVVAMGVFTSLHVLITLGPRRAEMLLLAHDRFLHRLGSPVFSFGRTLGGQLQQDWKEALRRGGIRTVTRAEFWRPFHSLRRTISSKSEVAAATLVREGERSKLTIVIGADVIEVGRYLPEPDREWLAEVLRLWLARG